MLAVSAWTNRTPSVWLAQLTRFAVVGLLATAIHIAVALMVTSVFSLAPLTANLSGFCAAVAVSFWGHLRVTFRVKEPQRQHFYRFVVLSLASLAVSSLITAIWTSLGGSMVVAMGLVALIVPIMSFLAARLWAFAVLTSQSTASGPKSGEPL